MVQHEASFGDTGEVTGPKADQSPGGEGGRGPAALQQDELRRRFVYHAPTAETRGIHDAIRALTLDYARRLNALVGGPSRESSLMFTALEEASFWAHAHVARNRQ